jgi:Fic family protein
MATEATDGHYEPFPTFSAWRHLTVGSPWSEYLAGLDAARQSAEPAHIEQALSLALRSAALETGAIEGLYSTNRGITRTVALQGAMWEAELEKLGPDVRGHFEAQLAALDLVLDAATRNLDLSEAWIRRLHAETCARQTTYRVLTKVGWQEHALHHGEYKTSPNNVILADGSTHWYAPTHDVPSEMHRLVEELRTSEFGEAHPVLQAGYAHHALTAVHPFSDGNGRTARALASVYLYRAAGIPLVIFSDQQERYWDALSAADRNQPQSFVTFIEDRALDTMALVTDRLRRARRPLDQQVAKIQDLLVSHGGLSHPEVQAVGARLTELVQQAFGAAIQSLPLPFDISVELDRTMANVQNQSTFWNQPYHSLLRGGAFHYLLRIVSPVLVDAHITPFIGVADEVSNRFTFIVIDANRGDTQPLRLRIGDLHPSVSSASETLIEGWAHDALQSAFRDLARGVASGLRGAGY